MWRLISCSRKECDEPSEGNRGTQGEDKTKQSTCRLSVVGTALSTL